MSSKRKVEAYHGRWSKQGVLAKVLCGVLCNTIALILIACLAGTFPSVRAADSSSLGPAGETNEASGSTPAPARWLIVPGLRATTSDWGEALGMELDRAVDGDVSTFFWSGRELQAGDWLQLDLGQPYSVSGIRLLMGSFTGEYARPNDYIYSGQVTVSTGDGKWETVGELTGAPEVSLLFAPRSVRLVRITVTQDQVYWAQIREIQLLTQAQTAASSYRPAWLRIESAQKDLTAAQTALQDALAQVADIDENQVQQQLHQADSLLQQAEAAYQEGQDDQAAGLANQAATVARQAQSLTWESRPVEVRAVWVDRAALLAGPQATRELLDRMASLGINLIFPEMVQKGAAAFPSAVAPRDEAYTAAWGDVDPLAFLVQEGHARGMQVVPWVWVFAAGYEHQFGPIMQQHPEWADLARDGSPFSPTQWGTAWLNPTLPQVQEYLTNLMLEIVTRYEVDGLQFDYIRYNEESHIPFGYAPSSLARFQEETGLDARTLTPGSAGYDRWNQWREQNITSFLRQLSSRLRAARPGLLLSAAVVPDPAAALRETHQNWPRWLREGLLDFVATMNYTSLPGEFWARAREARSASPDPSSGSRILDGLGIWLLTPEHLLDEVAAARELPSLGVVFFAASTLSGEVYARLQEGPFRQPALSPLADPHAAAQMLVNRLLERWNTWRARGRLPMTVTEQLDPLLQKLGNGPQAGSEAASSGLSSPGSASPAPGLDSVSRIRQEVAQVRLQKELVEQPQARALLDRLAADLDYLALCLNVTPYERGEP
ncbi:MAG: family 10 glycosylhydrolase [Limnochordaceae bacterium]|nr:family 10 glycosylhydrolase [Limnochordaceae bacterium]